jgi:hypothetical protein
MKKNISSKSKLQQSVTGKYLVVLGVVVTAVFLLYSFFKAEPVQVAEINNRTISATSSYFTDVPLDHPHYQGVEAMRVAGIMVGCGINPNMFCPDQPVPRALAPYIIMRTARGVNYVPPAPTVQAFTDVPKTHPFYAWIGIFARKGITIGCTTTTYCPNSPMTRGQIAVFILRTKYGGSYVPPAAKGIFTDVPTTHLFAAYIEKLASLKITSGCGNNKYCPEEPVTRAEMATMLSRAFLQ